VLNQAVARQRDATAFYVLDSELMEMSPPQGTLPRVTIERLRSHGGTVVESDTLEGLCRQLEEHGVHGKRAVSTLREFNAAILEERAEELFPERREYRFPLVSPPFTAVPVRSGITFSNGGLEVDTEMRVLRRTTTISTLPNVVARATELKFDVIPGLFAAGCDVGNINHGGYMGGLAPALVTGRIAGYSAADLVKSARTTID
jgi:succinate dehydrogenase/fumarate reductase flavoprotein subunit